MVRGVVALAALAPALVALPSATAFRADPPPPRDGGPIWSPDASAIVFTRAEARSGSGLRVMASNGTGERPLPVPSGVLSPDWRWIASTKYEYGSPPAIFISTPEGEGRRLLVEGAGAAWAPSRERLAFVPYAGFGRVPAIDIIGLDGSGRRRLADRAELPAWSPDGRRLAFLDLSNGGGSVVVGVVDADGRNRRSLGLAAGKQPSAFAWSPDGNTIAVLSRATLSPELGLHNGSTLALVRVRDRRIRKYAIPGIGTWLDWSPDGRHIALDGIFRFDVARGTAVRLARFGVTPRFSPSGRQIAFAGGGACGFRAGIFVVNTLGSRPARLTNDCRVLGGPGTDMLRGSEFTDVLLGRGGDDTLTAFDDFFYEGDELDGGEGADVLIGSIGTDVLRGGPGRDRFDGGSAPDVIYAADGERDVVACGTTRGTGVRDLDRAYVDQQDLVRDDCEFVFRRGVAQPQRGTWLSITVWPRGRAGVSHRRTLQCAPPRGTLPNRATACAMLDRFGDPFAPIPVEADCPTRTAEPALARIVGRFRGRYVTVWMQRTDGCEIARWDHFAFLFVS
jgi:Tol biopolymer transport system component